MAKFRRQGQAAPAPTQCQFGYTDARRTPGIPGPNPYPAIRFDTAAQTPQSLVVENRCIASLSRLVFPTCPVRFPMKGKRADRAPHKDRHATHFFCRGRPGEQGQVRALLYDSVGQSRGLERFRISNTHVQTACRLGFPPHPNPLPPGERGWYKPATSFTQ